MESSEGYFLGLRVVRGRKWIMGKEIGPGSVGTIINYTKDGSKVHVEVKWDTGTISTVEHPGSNTLLVLNTASIGVTHFLSCSVCHINPVYGYCWRCSVCDDIKLCSRCYNAGKHSLKHAFARCDDDSSSTDVGKRKGTKKLKVRGLYKGATVIRQQNNGAKDKGKVVTVTTDDVYTTHIKWKSGPTEAYRIDEEGKMMELICRKSASGGSYYADHMPEPWELDMILEDAGYVAICAIRPRPEQPPPKPRYVDPNNVVTAGPSSGSTAPENINNMVKIQDFKPKAAKPPPRVPKPAKSLPMEPTPDVTCGELARTPLEANEGDSDSEIDDGVYLTPYEIEEVEAIMDFFPVSDEEIGFYKGDVIVNVSKVDDEWLRGHVNGKFGYFPCDYVKIPGQPCLHPTTGCRRVDKIT